ncbi:hypothetical protein JKP88DRAFT_325731 [Tribonema minus]|uniref:Uncharacterized protein n=1 Tax=Tribonema minus TaxID=303371 RepID=A0A836CBM0_9STRA|nr:hypothetical protein JKP88DRAFT_325731 [Tribonema minus]
MLRVRHRSSPHSGGRFRTATERHANPSPTPKPLRDFSHARADAADRDSGEAYPFLILLALLLLGVLCMNLVCLSATDAGYFAAHVDCRDLQPSSESSVRALGFWVGWRAARTNIGGNGVQPSYPLSELSAATGCLGGLVGLGHIMGLNFTATSSAAPRADSLHRGLSAPRRPHEVRRAPKWTPLRGGGGWGGGERGVGGGGLRSEAARGRWLGALCRASLALSAWFCAAGLLGFYFAVAGGVGGAVRRVYESSFQVQCGTQSHVDVDFAYVMTGLACLAHLSVGIFAFRRRPQQQQRRGARARARRPPPPLRPPPRRTPCAGGCWRRFSPGGGRRGGGNALAAAGLHAKRGVIATRCGTALRACCGPRRCAASPR